ncbi:tRNA (adenosine(37)-N6)-threonylcarbamoyltransferase complex ATPase subunit type 1 TsaE [uncultured Halopseudomonas sp.]|uniref:tRNA (adenosine(37)-N6)-threonylcarbamoyltransferase complex ATPase subunit type 1 TsaE n=1 Tax=uncultured Halopseudomonas sp. TaxID=2901193 RepID=UPI0030EDBB02|tara:strand:+ start:107757 stop:108233 length:477 start_codon:yes stop_codon:yes gene_type:complete
MIQVIHAEGDQAMEAVGAAIGRAMQARGVIYLQGDLGAGKTTLSRGLIRGQGHSGAVKSPTFTLVEPYELNDSAIYHFDLYRLLDPEELEFLGIRDYFSPDSLCMIEWPEKGAGVLPSPDMTITIGTTPTGRRLEVQGHSEHGQTACRQLQTRDDAQT